MKNNKNIFFCKNCNYECCKKFLWNQHLATAKHINKQMETQETKIYQCVKCSKKFMNRSGLWKHNKKCNTNIVEHNIQNNDKDEMKDLVMKLINENSEIKNSLLKENNELRKQLKEQNQQINELIPKIGNGNYTININNKQKFNINVFLIEKCKDALSMDDFINKIEISMKNLLTTKEKGQTYGISNIIIENMNKLSLYERPMHCTDKKRETLYVKNDKWEKDENKAIINKALKDVERKQMQNINVWLEEHPNYMNNSQQQEEFANLISECGKSVDDGREKIIKNVCDNVYLDKEYCNN